MCKQNYQLVECEAITYVATSVNIVSSIFVLGRFIFKTSKVMAIEKMPSENGSSLFIVISIILTVLKSKTQA
jgi:hypothetical protein